MRHPLVRALSRALTRSLVLAAAAAVIPLASAAPAAADGVVVGGFPVEVSEGPWTVALSSRDRFGGIRAGQFCGGVAVGRTTVLTAAHCMGEDVLGAPPNRVQDLKVITGRTDLTSTQGKEIAVHDTWVNPGYDKISNAGDFAVLTLAESLPQSSVIGMAAAGDPAYQPGTSATVYGWGDITGGGDYARGLRAARVHVLSDALCERAYPGSADGTYRADSMLCAGEAAGGRMPARGTVEGRWSPRGGWSGSCPGGVAADGPAARASIRGSRTSYGRWGGATSLPPGTAAEGP